MTSLFVGHSSYCNPCVMLVKEANKQIPTIMALQPVETILRDATTVECLMPT